MDRPREKESSIEELYERAALHATLAGWRDEAYDFAGWLAIKWLEGKSQHQRISDAFIDYLRAQYGGPRRSRGRYQLSRAMRSALRAIATEQQSSPEEAFERGLARHGQFNSNHPEHASIERESHAAGEIYFHSPRRREVFRLARQGLNHREIGIFLGVTESRVHQMITEMCIAVKRKKFLAARR